MTIKQILALACAAAPVSALVAPRSSPVKPALRAWGPDWDMEPESVCIHGGWAPDPATTARVRSGVIVSCARGFAGRACNAETVQIHAGRARLPHGALPVRVDGEGREALRARGARQHLFQDHEPDDGRPREAHGAARGRAGVGWIRRGLGHERCFLFHHQPRPGGRQHRECAKLIRRHVHAIQGHPAYIRYYGEVRRLELSLSVCRSRGREDAGLLHGDRQQPGLGRGRHQGHQ
jgi:hypothetical protein